MLSIVIAVRDIVAITIAMLSIILSLSPVFGISYVILSMVLAFLCCIPATLALATFLLQQNPYTNFGLVVLFIWLFSIVTGVILTIYNLASTIKEYRLDKEAPKQSVMDFADDNGNKYRVHFTLY